MIRHAWAFLAANFAGASTHFFTGDPFMGLGVATAISAVWCAFVAIAAWQPEDGGE